MSERSSQRYDISVGVIVRWEGKSEPCLSRTLSKGGVSVGTQKRWPVGTVVDVEMVHEKTRLRTTARVANANPTTVGLEFYQPSPEFEAQLLELLERFVPQARLASIVHTSKNALG
ncbi:MAG: PilZ domain-containing protein, partial [Clostridia bacterium]|nr:PilZ domain-containing protein [Deltaproteobacteria bacterium]